MIKDPLLYLYNIPTTLEKKFDIPARFQELIDIIGVTAACRVLYVYGGYSFYCGKKAKDKWIELVGATEADKFFHYYGGCNVKLPQCKRILATIMHHNKASCNFIASALKVDVNTVSRWIKDNK